MEYTGTKIIKFLAGTDLRSALSAADCPLSRRALRLIGAMVLVIVLAPLKTVIASPNIVGFVDGLNGSFAGGWACVQGANQPVSVAVYFGLNLLGVFPTTVQRSDIGTVCGSATGTYGFNLNFVPNLNQQLLSNADQLAGGRNEITIYAISNGYNPVELPPSTSGISNPFTVPSGSISTASATGSVTGEVSGPSISPPVAIYAGASQTSGGSLLEAPTIRVRSHFTTC